MKIVCVSAVIGAANNFKATAIVDKLPKDQRGAIVKVSGFADATIHRVATMNKSVLPKPDLPRSATIFLSTRDLDHDRDIVTPNGWDKSLYRGQGIWAHDYKLDPIYKALETESDDYGLYQLIQFAETERGENYWQLVKNGFLQTFSAGMWVKRDGMVQKSDSRFDSMKALCKDWPEFTPEIAGQVERFIVNKYLIESTLCNVPSNPFALVVAVNKGDVVLSDGVKKEIHFEDIVKKTRDAGDIEGKAISTVVKGDLSGHEFRGNQYSEGQGGGDSDEASDSRAIKHEERRLNETVTRTKDKIAEVESKIDVLSGAALARAKSELAEVQSRKSALDERLQASKNRITELQNEWKRKFPNKPLPRIKSVDDPALMNELRAEMENRKKLMDDMDEICDECDELIANCKCDKDKADDKAVNVVIVKTPVQVEVVKQVKVLSAEIPLETIIEKTIEKKLALIRGGL